MSIDFSDQDLVSRVRHGDTAAFGDLYAHHSAAAHRAARRISRDPHVAEDVVSEAFARVFKALQAGQGPTGDLFPYLLVTMRNVAASWGRESVKWTPVGDDAPFQPRDARDLEVGADELPVDRLNMSLTTSAFETLPRRWRTVLWYLEVEGETATEVGQRLGLSDVAVRQLARRAREGLREAYLAAYLGGEPATGEHVPSADLVSMARGKLSLRRRAGVEKHLDTCPKCSGLLFEAAEENSTLRALALPFYLAAAFAVVKWWKALAAHVPHLPGWQLFRHPAAQAGLVATSIVAVVATALVVPVNFRGDDVGAARAGGAQSTGSGGGGSTGANSASSASSSASASSVSASASSASAGATASATPSVTNPTTTSLPTTVPTVATSGAPVQTFATALPTVIFPTVTTLPPVTIPTTAPTVVPTSQGTAATTPPTTSTTPASTTPASTTPASTTTAPATATTEPPTTEPTTEPTTAAPTTTEPTTTPPTVPPAALVEVDGSLTYDDTKLLTTFSFTITNDATAAVAPRGTIVLPAGVVLSVYPYWNCGYHPGLLTLHCWKFTKVGAGSTNTYQLVMVGEVTQKPDVSVIQPPY